MAGTDQPSARGCAGQWIQLKVGRWIGESQRYMIAQGTEQLICLAQPNPRLWKTIRANRRSVPRHESRTTISAPCLSQTLNPGWPEACLAAEAWKQQQRLWPGKIPKRIIPKRSTGFSARFLTRFVLIHHSDWFSLYEPPVLNKGCVKTGCGCAVGNGTGVGTTTCRAIFGCARVEVPMGASAARVG